MSDAPPPPVAPEPLRPWQGPAIEFALRAPNRRAIFDHPTGAGKTRSALEVAKATGAKRLLVVAPAKARATWIREAAKWLPGVELHPVRYGRERKSLTKAQTAQRDASYAAEARVTSYDLVKQTIDPRPVDFVIIDELHDLRDPLSQQSKAVRAYLRAHPSVPCVGLTATLIPTEVQNVWNPLDTFWPGQFGRATKTGDVSFQFKRTYCAEIESEYATSGYSYSGSAGPEAEARLAKLLEKYVHSVSDREVAPYLPKLNATPLYLDVKRNMTDLAKDWFEVPGTGRPAHQCLVFFNRDAVHAAAEALAKWDPLVLTGETPVEKRDAAIQAIRQQPSSLIIAGSEAIRESIDLSFVSRALIQQWRTTPAQALQLMGRFRRMNGDLDRPTHIEYAVQPGEEGRAELLSERIRAVNGVLGSGQNSETLLEIFAPRPLTEERLEGMCLRMFATARLDREDWEDDDDE